MRGREQGGASIGGISGSVNDDASTRTTASPIPVNLPLPPPQPIRQLPPGQRFRGIAQPDAEAIIQVVRQARRGR